MGRAQTSAKYDPTLQGVQQIIERAVKNKVSDIHIEPGERFVLIRYRRGGLLYTANKLPKATAVPLAIYLKTAAGLDPLQTQIPQIGQYNLQLGAHLYSLEIATLPILDGEKITIQLNNDKEIIPDLRSLGLWGDNLLTVERSLTQSKGVILIAGRQSTQITTILSTLLMQLETASLKRAFISTKTNALPPSIKSIAVQPEAGLSVARQLALLLKDNFTVIGINNVSDKKTARSIVEAAASRCLILTGMLADNAMGAITLLQHMYASHTTAAAINLAVGQTFVSRLCPDCRESYQPSMIELEQLTTLFHLNQPNIIKTLHQLEKAAALDGLEPDLELSSSIKAVNRLWKAKTHGCKSCDHTGFTTDIGIFEVCIPSDQLRSSIANDKPTSALQKLAVSDGMLSLSVDGLIKALRGLIDIPTLLSVCATTN